ncbi:MAG: ATP-binding protein [Candidatus Muiribacteriota bacterium]|jgi:anti-sigma regulatory factor (Ser/Thr protein kinase)
MKKFEFQNSPSSLKEVRVAIEKFFSEKKINDIELESDMKLASVELAANIVKHSTGSSKFIFTISKKQNNINIIFEYTDINFVKPVSDKKIDIPKENGYGLYIVEKLCDKLSFNYKKKLGKVKVSCEKRITS